MSRRYRTAFLLLLAIPIGALREFLFINLNYQIDHLQRSTAFSYAHSLFQGWVDGWSLHQLGVLKWTCTLVFIAAMLSMALLLARIQFGSNRYTPAIILIFVGLSTIALLLHAIFGAFDAMERVAVVLLHALQYPVPLLFILLARPLMGERGRKEQPPA
ncbi:MAG: hypothetical protein H6595_02445 [Flavobacteriales bacterium]|nr:hypothetical protein [Flavobacteriales bacterium]MCB9166319.1 hypothetical protein [Flavobacteriales bacterium]